MNWLIALLVAPAEAEAINGDLHEERLAIASREGQAAASQWYRRQVVRTVGHLAVSPFRQSPIAFTALGFLGLALVLPISWLTRMLAGFIVVRVPVYQYIPATAYWQATSVVSHLAVGALIAIVMRRRAMSAALAVVLAIAVWVTALGPMLLAVVLPPKHMPPPLEYATRELAALFMYGTSVLVSTALGVLVRRRISRPRVTHSA